MPDAGFSGIRQKQLLTFAPFMVIMKVKLLTDPDSRLYKG